MDRKIYIGGGGRLARNTTLRRDRVSVTIQGCQGKSFGWGLGRKALAADAGFDALVQGLFPFVGPLKGVEGMSGNRFNPLALVVVMLAALGCARHPWVRVGVPGSRDITILIHSERVLDGGGTQYDSSIYVLQSGGQEFVYGLLGSHLNRLWMRASDGVFVWDYLVDGAELRRMSEQVGDADIFGGQVAAGSFSANGMLVIESGRESYAMSPFRSYNLEEQGLERACWNHSLSFSSVPNGKQWPQDWICYAASPVGYAYGAIKCVAGTPLRALAAGRTLGVGNVFYNDCRWLWWNFGNGRAWYMDSPLLPKFPDYLLEEVKP